MKMVAKILCLILAILVGGFLQFIDQIQQLEARGIAPDRTDGIVVFTGGADRVDVGIDILKRGSAKRLLISGVYPGTTAKDLAQDTGIDSALFACCIDLGYDALDTVGNAQETADWVQARAYTSVRIVTTAYHLPRSLVEMRRRTPELTLVAHPIQSLRIPTKSWWLYPSTSQFLVREYFKYLVSLLRWRTDTAA